jgi:23S rRNA (uridine2552-2'-O)-methyltransferase
VAPAGRVVAIDLLKMMPLPGVTFIQGDFSESEGLVALERELSGSRVDLVLSDMAPNISGISLADQSHLMGLVELALDFSIKHLKPQGNFLVKVFHGAGFDEYVKALRSKFIEVQTRKPDASRKGSREVYLLAKGLKQV